MKHNNQKNLGEVFDVKFTSSLLDTIKVYAINGIDDADDITPSIDIQESNGIYSQEVTMPDTDSWVVVLVNGVSQVLRVGKPEPIVIFYGKADNYHCVRRTVDGDVLDDKDMSKVGPGLFTMTVSDYGYSIVEINGLSAVFDPRYCDGAMKGTIYIEANSFKGVHLNVNDTVGNYLVKQIENQNSVICKDVIKYFKTYVHGEMYTFIPGSTPIGSKWDFNLLDDDGLSRCIWVDSLDFDETLKIDWVK